MTSISTLESCLLDIDELISQKQYAEALSRLQTLESDTLRCLEPLAISGVFYRYAKCLYHLGEYSASLDKLDSAISISRVGTDHVLYAHQKQLLGFICRATGQVDEAVQAFLESYTARLRAEDFQSIYASLVNLGLSHMLKGDLRQGCVWFANALKYAEEYNTPEEVAVCKINLCLLALLMGDFSRVHELIRSIDTKALTEINKARVVELRGKFAVYQLDFATAETNLNEALNHHRKASVQRDQIVCLEYLALNECFQGNCRKAKEYCRQALDMPEPTASAIAQTLRMLTDVYIAEGNWGEAKETAIAAEAAITKINERIELAALWRAQAQIAENDSDHDAARAFFQKSIDLLQQCGAHYELAMTYLAAGGAGCLDAETRKERLQQAKTLFTEMDVPKRVSQVDTAIKAIAKGASWAYTGMANVNVDQALATHVENSRAPVIIGQSKAMRDAQSRADKVKNTDHTILITGETGTGKDMLAKYVHYTSTRASKSFRLINMAAVPDSLLESELFGHRKGAFTNATEDKPGLLMDADGGTFFLNEIGEAPLTIQAKLLDVIESKEVRRLGGSRDTKINIRFIAATNQDLVAEVKGKRFREDLHQRLRVLTIELPPLRNHKEDMPALFTHFLRVYKFRMETLSASDMSTIIRRLNQYSWPGNIRELRHLAVRIAELAPDGNLKDVLTLVDEFLVAGDDLDDQTKHERLLAALKRHGGVIARAAEELGTPESTVRYYLKKHNRD